MTIDIALFVFTVISVVGNIVLAVCNDVWKENYRRAAEDLRLAKYTLSLIKDSGSKEQAARALEILKS